MVYRMIFNQTAYFGRGAIKEIPAVAKQHGFTKAFIVTDPVLLETGTAEKVTKVLDDRKKNTVSRSTYHRKYRRSSASRTASPSSPSPVRTS